MSIECLYMYNLDSCRLRIPCGCQIEELFLSWIFNECVHPLLPHFLASSGTLEPLGLKSYSRPTSVILFWWEKSHPSSCTGSAWKALRKRVFPLSVDWHLDTDMEPVLPRLDFFDQNKTKHMYTSPFLGGLKGMPAGHQNLGSNGVTAHFLRHCEWRQALRYPDPASEMIIHLVTCCLPEVGK